MEPARILVVDDEPSICDVLGIALRKEGYEVVTETNPLRALERIEREPFDVILQDLRMPQMDGIELLRRIRELRPEAAVIIMTAYSTWDRAVEAMRLGAYHYIKKPFDTQVDIKGNIARALRSMRDRRHLPRGFDEMLEDIGLKIGYSKPMREVRDLILRAAPADSTVLIQGESGVGKELVARALHFGSPRASRDIVSVNCGALTETLLESELFGHEKGAFTHALAMRKGRFELAEGGTLFLDEVAEMSPALQVKFLRVLQEMEFERVGGTKTIRVDVRVVAASNRDLKAEVEAGNFREDLFYRLNVVHLHLPPLRQRTEDIPLLVTYFIQKYAEANQKGTIQLEPGVMKILVSYPWPGNVRELENVIERAVILCSQNTITVNDLPPEITEPPKTDFDIDQLVPGHIPLPEALEKIEELMIRRALHQAGYVQVRAAEFLGITKSLLQYKLKKYQIT